MLPEHLVARLDAMADQAAELEKRMLDPEVASNHLEYRRVNTELAGLKRTVDLYLEHKQAIAEAEEAKAILADGGTEADIRELAEMQLEESQLAIVTTAEAVRRSLVSDDPDDVRDAIVEIRAGTGGDEAALWAGDLFRLYKLYAQNHKWSIEVMDDQATDQGGFKQVNFAVKGKGAFGGMKYESGVHRVQRVPQTETQGASTRPPPRWPSCPRPKTSRSSSTSATSRWRPCAPVGPVARTSTRRRRPCV